MESNSKSKGTLRQIYDDFSAFGATDEMTLGEFKAYMQEQDRERKFNERWLNRDYNNEKATYSRFYHKNPLIRMTGNQIKIYITLMAFAKTTNKIAVSAPVLKDLTGLSDLTIRKAVKELEEYGFLTRSRNQKSDEPTLYMLNPEISSCCKTSLQDLREHEFKDSAKAEYLDALNRLKTPKEVFVSVPVKNKQGIVIAYKIEKATEDIKKDGATNTVRTKSKTLKHKTSIPQEQHENQDSRANFDFDNDPEIPFNNFNMPKDSKAKHTRGGTIMEKPIPPNPDTMTDEEFDRWLEAEFIWESEQIEKALFPDGIPEDTSTPEEKEAAWQEFVARAKEKGIWRED